MKKFIAFYCFLFLMAHLVGCTTTPGAVYIENLTLPLVDIQKVIQESLPVGKRIESLNQREYYSEYFVEKGGEFVAATGEPYRRTAQISIFGDRRPYKIEVIVMVERRGSGGNYTPVRPDEGMARVITRRIQSTLHKRREDRNIIDDFRVF
jgi:hypothetical protein